MISCFNKKIDFVSDIEGLGFRIVLAREVFQELKDLKSKLNREERIAIDYALKLFESKRFKKISLGNESVDSGLIKKGKNGFYIATLDSEIKRNVPNKILILNSQNKIGIERS